MLKQSEIKSLESWRYVWRNGFSKVMSMRALEALRDGLKANDPRIIQGSTTCPPPLMCVADWPCEGACPLGYSGWQGEDKNRVRDVEEYFAKMCFDSDEILGYPAACRFLLNWFNDTPRDEMIRELLPEVELALQEKVDEPRQEATD